MIRLLLFFSSLLLFLLRMPLRSQLSQFLRFNLKTKFKSNLNTNYSILTIRNFSTIKMSNQPISNDSFKNLNPSTSFCPPTNENDNDSTSTSTSPSHKRQKLSNSIPESSNSSDSNSNPIQGSEKDQNGNVKNVNKKKKNQKVSEAPSFPLEQPEGFALDCPTLPERISKSKLNYENTLTLAPMVRVGSLPTRLLSLQYGADLVWGAEVIDRAIIPTERIVDARTGHIEWMKDGKQIFSTHPIERSKVIFQLGSASPELATLAIRKICNNSTSIKNLKPDIAAICLNCGCPKHFSTHGGMGANLLYTPSLLCSILIAIRKEAPESVSVHAKIRLLPSQKDTLALVRAIVKTNAVDCITVHCRTKDMRPREPALPDRMREIRDEIMKVGEGKVKVGCNGDAWDADEALKIKELTGVTSVMIARGAEANPSVFRTLSEGGPVSVPDVIIPQWIRYHTLFNNSISNSKFCISGLSYSNQPFHFTSGPPVQSRIDSLNSIKNNDTKVPKISSNSDSKKWTKEKLKSLRQSISQCKTSEDLEKSIGFDENQLEKEKNGDWKSSLADLGKVMKEKFDWDWIQETEEIIKEEMKLKEIKLAKEEEGFLNQEDFKMKSVHHQVLESDSKIEVVAHQSNPPETKHIEAEY